MSSRPLVSICIPVYNGQRHLGQALESALAQSYEPCEIIVVDNASTDRTPELIQDFVDRHPGRICVHRNDVTVSMVENFNVALGLARGDYLKLLPHDDVLTRESIADLMTAAAPGREFLAGLRGFIFEDAPWQVRFRYWRLQVLSGLARLHAGCRLEPSEYLARAGVNTCFNFIGEPGSILFSARALSRVGGFDPRFSQLCDLELWHRLGSSVGLCLVPRKVALFRVHSSSASSSYHHGAVNSALIENMLLSASVIARSAGSGNAAAESPLLANYLVDLFRLRLGNGSAISTELRSVVTSPTVTHLLEGTVRLPVKRIYQLLVVRTLLPILLAAGATATVQAASDPGDQLV